MTTLAGRLLPLLVLLIMVVTALVIEATVYDTALVVSKLPLLGLLVVAFAQAIRETRSRPL